MKRIAKFPVAEGLHLQMPLVLCRQKGRRILDIGKVRLYRDKVARN